MNQRLRCERTGLRWRDMKLTHLYAALALLSFVIVPIRAADEATTPAQKADAPTPMSPLKTDLRVLLEKVDTKLSTGPVAETALAEELAAFDQLLVKHKEAQAEELVMVLIYKAMLYLQVLENFEQADLTLQKIKTDFPKAPQIAQVDQLREVLAKQKDAAKIQKQLEPGNLFPDFEEKSLTGETISVAKYKGDVVLLDFWATWCGPCIEDRPAIIALHKKYQPRGLRIIGISLDRDASALNKYLEEQKITWPQIFDGKFWDAKLAQQYGVTSIPFTLLINGDGRIVGRNLRGPALEAELAKLLGP
jgi:thiol-disulfide isomerase/thioredoxin